MIVLWFLQSFKHDLEKGHEKIEARFKDLKSEMQKGHEKIEASVKALDTKFMFLSIVAVGVGAAVLS